METKSHWMSYSSAERKMVNKRFLYSVKLSFKNEGEIDILNNQKQKLFTNKPVPQEIWEILQAKARDTRQ